MGHHWHYLARIWRIPVLGEVFMAGSTRPGFGLVLRHGNKGGLPKAFMPFLRGVLAAQSPSRRGRYSSVRSVESWRALTTA